MATVFHLELYGVIQVKIHVEGGGKINVKKIHLGWAGVKFAVLA